MKGFLEFCPFLLKEVINSRWETFFVNKVFTFVIMKQKYVMAAIDVALKAGGKILSIYNDPASDFEIERKADNSPLTIADLSLIHI